MSVFKRLMNKKGSTFFTLVFCLFVTVFVSVVGTYYLRKMYVTYFNNKEAQKNDMISSISFNQMEGKLYMDVLTVNNEQLSRPIQDVKFVETTLENDMYASIRKGILNIYSTKELMRDLLNQTDFSQLSSDQVELIYDTFFPEKEVSCSNHTIVVPSVVIH